MRRRECQGWGWGGWGAWEAGAVGEQCDVSSRTAAGQEETAEG